MTTALDPSRIPADVDRLAPTLRDVSSRIHKNPELCFEEHRAVGWLAEAIEGAGVAVERNLGGLPTAFRARVGRGAGPRVAILAEYDALPEIGHACGHNLIATGALGAFLALARQADAIEGAVEIVGTPAEEGGGGKIKLLQAGAFEGAFAAMMFHPFDRDLLAHPTLATVNVTLRFHGKPSHAAIAPWDGNSALTACMDAFRLIDSQRVHFRDGVRVHGYITNGGQAVNIIPELAEAVFLLRAPALDELTRIQAIVERCARGAATASGVEVVIAARPGYKNMISNLAMAHRFGAHLEGLGHRPVDVDPDVGTGSTDMGDVSHALPSIHPWLAICARGERARREDDDRRGQGDGPDRGRSAHGRRAARGRAARFRGEGYSVSGLPRSSTSPVPPSSGIARARATRSSMRPSSSPLATLGSHVRLPSHRSSRIDFAACT
jgi:amidohydrolase